MMPLMAGWEALSPISRYPAGRSAGSSGTEKPLDPMTIAAMVAPGATSAAQRDAGPAGSCSTTSMAKWPVAGSDSEIVYARWNSVSVPSGSGNQNRSQEVGSVAESSKIVGDTIWMRTQCGANRCVLSTVTW